MLFYLLRKVWRIIFTSLAHSKLLLGIDRQKICIILTNMCNIWGMFWQAAYYVGICTCHTVDRRDSDRSRSNVEHSKHSSLLAVIWLKAVGREIKLCIGQLHLLDMKRKSCHLEPLQIPIVDSWVGDDDSGFFTYKYGRKLNSLSPLYALPVDDEEIKVRYYSSTQPCIYPLLIHIALSTPALYHASFIRRFELRRPYP